MKELDKSMPLMFIQGNFSKEINCNNQTYFDSRYHQKIKKEPLIVEEKTISDEEKNDLLNKVKLIDSASKKGLKVTSEVVFRSGEVLNGVVSFNDDETFILDNDFITYRSILEINIQTIKNI